MRNRLRWDWLADIAYTFNVTVQEAMKMDTNDRKYGMGIPNRLSDYLCS